MTSDYQLWLYKQKLKMSEIRQAGKKREQDIKAKKFSPPKNR